MTDYKLYYFPIKGRAERIRLLFAYKGIKYDDIRITHDKWIQFKSQTPFGTLPVLKEPGEKTLSGSLVILRYLAEKEEFNVAGSNAWENAWLGSLSDYILDLQLEMAKIRLEKDQERKLDLIEKFNTQTGPKYFTKLNSMLTTSEEGGIYLSFRRRTWPDFQLYSFLEREMIDRPELISEYPNLIKFKASIESEPGIAEWLKQRPQTDY